MRLADGIDLRVISNAFFLCFLLLVSPFKIGSLYAQESGINTGVSFEIRNLFETYSVDGLFEIGDQRLYHYGRGVEFYAERQFREAWSQGGELKCNAYELRYQVQQSRFDGLIPEDYHLGAINVFFSQLESKKRNGDPPTEAELAFLDILLTDAYLELATHIYMGKVDPGHREFGWEIKRKEPRKEVLVKLRRAVDECDVRKSLEELYPNFTIYKRMRNSLMAYYDKAKETPKNWKTLTVSKSIKPYESHELIPQVRSRLDFWEERKEENTYGSESPEFYDSVLVKRVERYQLRHGLNPDGVLGNATLRALNKTPNDLINQVSVNMERLRWLPDTTLSEFILVNIANFSMDYIRGRDTLLHSNAIVGKSYRKTPVFNAPMTYLVFSPTWTVPPTILRNDVVPAIKRDVNYLKSKNMRLLTRSGQEVDPNTVDWSKITASNFPYMVRQDPGPANSLGWVKFMFPNKHNVYLHDTPSRDLFARDDRALSSGCIRIQKPLELARLLLADQPLWSDDRIRTAMHSGREQTVMLKRQIPVILLYLTFWTDSEGIPMVRHDLYDRDNTLFTALSQSVPFTLIDQPR